MGHAVVDNQTPFAFEALLLVDENCTQLAVPVIKATFSVGADGRCTLAEEQIPVDPAGKVWGEDPEKSSYRYEPEVAFFKPATDVVLVGNACAPRAGTTELQVGVTVGPARSFAMVYGDRLWFRTSGSVVMTRPLPFDEIPLVYERAFGGWDRRDPDPSRHECEPRNPVGAGFRREFEEELRLPNIEDPRTLIREFGDRPAPAGFGFVSPHWHPRAAFAGTYDEAWQTTRAPALPADFDRRHLNAASAGLVVQGYLRGDEAVTAMGVTRRGTFAFSLPAVPAPAVRVVRQRQADSLLETRLDTLIIEPSENRIQIIWRAHLPLRAGPHELKAIQIRSAA